MHPYSRLCHFWRRLCFDVRLTPNHHKSDETSKGGEHEHHQWQQDRFQIHGVEIRIVVCLLASCYTSSFS